MQPMVVSYVRNLRHWLYPELFPVMHYGMSHGEWYSF